MTNSLPEAAFRLLLCVTGALITVLLLRLPLRQAFGPRIAYTIWLLVPIAAVGLVVGSMIPVKAVAAIVLPAQTLDVRPLWLALPTVQVLPSETKWVILCWMIGAGLFALMLWWQQNVFVRRLGVLQYTPTGAWMAEADDIGPVVVGVFPPKIVLPADFYRRYTRQEQALVFAHESMHIVRRDPLANLANAVARSLLWFHPLVHLATRYFRIDQEFACDAAVLQGHPWDRYHYAYALLRGQMGGPTSPAGCHLDSHAAMSLKKRITMLQTSSPSRGRRVLGTIVVAISVIAGGSVVTFLTACVEEKTAPERVVENTQSTPSNHVSGSTANGIALTVKGAKLQSKSGPITSLPTDGIALNIEGGKYKVMTNGITSNGTADGQETLQLQFAIDTVR